MSPTWRTAVAVAGVGAAALVVPWWLAAVGLLAIVGATAADLAAVRREVSDSRSWPEGCRRVSRWQPGPPTGVCGSDRPRPPT